VAGGSGDAAAAPVNACGTLEVQVYPSVADDPLPAGLIGSRRGQPVVVQPDLVVLLALQGEDPLLLQLLLDLALLLDPLVLKLLLLPLTVGRLLVGGAEVLQTLIPQPLLREVLILEPLILEPLLLLELLDLRGRGDGADTSDWSDRHGSHNLRLPLSQR
jgi:hypothetical protein